MDLEVGDLAATAAEGCTGITILRCFTRVPRMATCILCNRPAKASSCVRQLAACCEAGMQAMGPGEPAEDVWKARRHLGGLGGGGTGGEGGWGLHIEMQASGHSF